MLHDSRVEANIPAGDLQRARDFYADELGLTPTAEYDGVWLQYATTGGTTFNIYQTEYAGKAGHTIAQWHVNDIEAEVRDLKAKGVVFEVYQGLRTAKATSCVWTKAFREPNQGGATTGNDRDRRRAARPSSSRAAWGRCAVFIGRRPTWGSS